jgi:hypothetical protein
MAHKPQSSRYQRLVAGFAASAFALLGLLTFQQHQANVVTAEVTRRPAVMTNYRNGCVVVRSKAHQVAAGNFRLCHSSTKTN